MDESNVRNPEPLESAPSAEARAETVEELRRQVEEKQDRLLRALAEVENVKRRTQREREEYIRYANESLLRDLVPVLDNLDRALEAARGTGEASGVVGGVELIQRELSRCWSARASRDIPPSATPSIRRDTRRSPVW